VDRSDAQDHQTSSRRNIKLVLEYDGTGLAGWQRQADRPTIQSHLENALSRLLNEPIRTLGAGRTDAGVHALGQVANFTTSSARSLETIVRGGNALLPAQISIRSAQEVFSGFNARYNALWKTYDYDLSILPYRPALNRFRVWHLGPGLDLQAMEAALTILAGVHDFAAFQSTGTAVQTTIRHMRSTELTSPEPGMIRISLTANGFLRHQVRAIAGTMEMVGRGRMTPKDVQAILASRDRGQAGPTAPAQGLCLREVVYGEDGNPDADA
jgi:tRNA pseudouridine38-40 synthase